MQLFRKKYISIAASEPCWSATKADYGAVIGGSFPRYQALPGNALSLRLRLSSQDSASASQPRSNDDLRSPSASQPKSELHATELHVTEPGGRASKTVRSQAEPGNENEQGRAMGTRVVRSPKPADQKRVYERSIFGSQPIG